MVYILIIAECDGDYIPNNGLRLTEFTNAEKIGADICESIRNFLGENCLLNPHSSKLQITDFYWEDPNVVEEATKIEHVDAFMNKVQEIVDKIVRGLPLEMLIKEPRTPRETFKIYTDDEFIDLTWTRTSLRIQYNMAPNLNKWSHINYRIITVPTST